MVRRRRRPKSTHQTGVSTTYRGPWDNGISLQRSACVASLLDEFEELHNSLVVIVTSNTFGVLDSADLFPQLVPGWQDKYDDNWNKDYESSTGVWSFKDAHSGNLYIHADHPRRAVSAIEPYWGSALGRIIHLTRTSMPNFA
jgi:hypothetical protein